MKSPLTGAILAGIIAAVISFLYWQQTLDSTISRSALAAINAFLSTAVVTALLAAEIAFRTTRA